MIQKPMLAEAIKDIKLVAYPCIATPKIDGIRCVIRDGKAVSRSLKPIRNDFVRTTLERLLPEGADGEIIVGDSFHDTTTAVMGRGGQPQFQFAMFDLVGSDPKVPYRVRLGHMDDIVNRLDSPFVKAVPWTVIESEAELLRYEEQCLAQGFEGVMVRKPDSPYKFGRSTVSQGWLLKLKRFSDSEAVILGSVEAYHNENEAVRNALGNIERSSAKSGKVPAGWLGNIQVRDLKSGVEFGIGGGFTLEQRQRYWSQRDKLVGKVVKYKFQPHGSKDAPRFPQFIGFRDPDDM